MIKDTTEYYYTDDNNQVDGPHPFVHIIQLRNEGKIFEDTLVCRTGETKWIPFGEVLAVANQKRKEQPKNINKTQAPFSMEHKQSLQESNRQETHTSLPAVKVEAETSIDKFKIANTGLLLIITVLLACQLITGNSSLPTTTITEDVDKEGAPPSSPVVPVTIQSSATLPVSVIGSDVVYEYGAVHVDRDDMAYAEKFHRERHGDKLEPIEIPTYKLHIGGYKGWDYVGILCNNGINGSWILVRRKKED